jgi:hypothetical protein
MALSIRLNGKPWIEKKHFKGAIYQHIEESFFSQSKATRRIFSVDTYALKKKTYFVWSSQPFCEFKESIFDYNVR